MIVLHRKTLDGAEVASLPDLSMQFVRRASHYPARIDLLSLHLNTAHLGGKSGR